MKFEVCILDVDYVIVDDNPVIRIWGKTKNGKNIVALDRTFKPYLYILPKIDSVDLRKKILNQRIEIKIESVEPIKRKIHGQEKEFLKIIVSNPLELKELRDFFYNWESVKEVYEYDIPFYKRYFIDNYIKPLDWFEIEGKEIESGLKVDHVLELESKSKLGKDDYPEFKILCFDIETIDNKIISISVVDNSRFSKVIIRSPKRPRIRNVVYVDTEEELVKKFISIIEDRDPDIISGYNSDGFDIPLLIQSAKRAGIDFIIGRDYSSLNIFGKKAYIKGRIHIDLYNFFDNILSQILDTESLSLENISEEILGISRKTLDIDKMKKYWSEGKIKPIITHNKRDANLCLKLLDKSLHQILELSRISGQTIFDCTRMSYSKLVGWLFMRKAYQVGEVFPNRPTKIQIEKRKENIPYTGGYVHPPKVGLHNNIALFDFKSLYPSIIILHNISPETLNCQCCQEEDLVSKENKVPDEEYFFCKIHKGFVPDIVRELYDIRSIIREKLKTKEKGSEEYEELKNREYAVKILSNAIYGYYAYPRSRWYSTICAKSIASWGRQYIKNIINEISEEIIYGDTDSVFVKISNENSAKKLLERLNNSLPNLISLDLKGFYKSGLFVSNKKEEPSKKRYALLHENGNIIIRGFEKVKTNWCKLSRNLQEYVIKSVLKNDIKKSVQYVKENIEKLEEGKIKLNELIIKSKITKPIDKYEHIDPHVSAAKKAINNGRDIKTGSLIRYIITKGTGSISERAEIFEDAKNYDPKYYLNNQILPAVLRILSDFGYKEEDLIPKKQYSLDSFIEKKPLEKISSKIKETFGISKN